MGGIETVTRLLGEALVKAGHAVTVVAGQPAEPNDNRRFDFRLLRRPRALRLLAEYREAEAVVLQGPTLRWGWPLQLQRRRALIVHHHVPRAADGLASKWLRGRLAQRARHAAVSQALAHELPWRTDLVLPNPYDAAVFRKDPTIGRTRDLVFVGRLIAEKGVAVLIQALVILRRSGAFVSTTIVGDGPERVSLQKSVCAQGLQDSVTFAGQVTGPALARLLCAHQALAIPSVYPEPFGVVALEGAACGCVIIGSDAGGLPEAIGSCGVTFPCGDAAALAGQIQAVLGSPEVMNKFRSSAPRHLARHHPDAVACRYLEVLC